MSFEGADIQDLDLSNTHYYWHWPGKKSASQNRLTDATFEYFHAGLLETEGWQRRLRFINNAQYDESLYIQLEQFLRTRGDPEQADKVFIRGQKRARHERLEGFLWYRSWIWEFFTAYGRRPSKVLIMMTGVVAIGAFVFRKRDDMDLRDPKFRGRRYNPIWYSLDLFAPIVDLEAASVWVPRRNKLWKWRYLRIHRLLGWVLVPIAIVAITGLLQCGAS